VPLGLCCAHVVKPRIANPRWLWVTALLVGALCIGAFAHAMLAPSERTVESAAPIATAPAGRGFGAGLVIGIAAGIAVGFAIARQRSVVVETSAGDHSSRSNP